MKAMLDLVMTSSSCSNYLWARGCFTLPSRGDADIRKIEKLEFSRRFMSGKRLEVGDAACSEQARNVTYVSCSVASTDRANLTNKGVVKFRPCIDIHKGKVKQIVGSTLRDLPDNGDAADLPGSLVTNFVSEKSAAEFAQLYKDDGLWGGHVIMLGADPASQAAALAALAAYPGGLQLGGGVNPDNAGTYLDAGASHVIVTSYVFSQGKMDTERLRKLVKTVGKQRLVLDLSCRKKDGQYFVVTDRWQRFSELAVNEETLVNLAASADEFLVHGVDVEGKRLGVDEELVNLLGKCSPIPVTYAGGASTLDDLERIRDAGYGAVDVTVGSALDVFGGDLPYQEVVAWHKNQELGGS